MKVKKRNGELEEMRYDKITKRINNLCYDLNMQYVDPTYITLKVTQGIYDGITTNELDRLAAETAASMTSTHPDYSRLAGRIAVSNLHKSTPKKFSSAIKELYSFVEPKTGKESCLIADELYKLVVDNKDLIDSKVVMDRDLDFDYFGIKTLERSYLLKIGDRIVERPQYLYMRVALGICKGDLDMAFKVYDDLSIHYYTHATPTLFNAGTPRPQMSSCFLIANKDDSIEGLFSTVKDVAHISKWAGGIGLHVHNVRAKGAYIRGTGGESDGLIPMMKTYNEVARWINQCFAPETTLYTNHGIKQINQINAGDLVLTKDGTYCEVGEVFEYDQSGNMLQITTEHSNIPLKLTDAHPLYAVATQTNLFTPTWIDSGELKLDDYLTRPIPKEINDTDITKEDITIYTLLLTASYYVNGNFVVFSNFDQYIEYLNNNNIDYVKSYDGESLHFKATDLKWFSEDLIEENRLVLGEKYLHLPLEKAIYFVKGIYDSPTTYFSPESYIDIILIDEFLVKSIEYQLLRFGVPTQVALYERGKKMYSVRIPLFKEFAELINKIPSVIDWISDDNFVYSKVTAIKKIDDYEGKVYDLKIKEEYNDPSYTLTSCLVHNGGKRKGSFAIYLEPWHSDIFDFIDLRKNTGKEEMRARDLFLALWTPNLFMKRIEEDGDWSLFSPDEAPNLSDVFDSPDDLAFTKLYEQYEQEGRARKVVKARKLMDKILEAQIETGTPYMLYKDHANYKSNQKNLGTIKSSNLCTEIIEYSSKDEQAVCNLASIALPKYIIDGEFNHQLLYDKTYQIVKNLNNVIDLNFYPTEETKRSNFRHRPVGLGVQGLADVFCMLGLPFESENADKLQTEIFETIYYAALKSSCDLAKEDGKYETFDGSPISQGILQYQMWGKTDNDTSGRWNWVELRNNIIANGVRNSLLVAPMPTASCQIKETEIVTEDGIKSYLDILNENGLNVEEIEKYDTPHWITLNEPVSVLTMNGFVLTDQIYYNGHKEVFKIEMEDGTVFEATANHRFLVNRNGLQEWVRVDELTEEDDIVNIYS